MKVPNIVARANKYITNPIQGLWAGRIAPWAVVHHIGRKSTRAYSTPVIAFVQDERLSIALNYGENSDWVKNVVAAGEFTLEQGGKKIEIAGVRVIPSDSPDIVKSARIPAMLADSVLYGRVVSGQ